MLKTDRLPYQSKKWPERKSDESFAAEMVALTWYERLYHKSLAYLAVYGFIFGNAYLIYTYGIGRYLLGVLVGLFLVAVTGVFGR